MSHVILREGATISKHSSKCMLIKDKHERTLVNRRTLVAERGLLSSWNDSSVDGISPLFDVLEGGLVVDL